jgi:transcriptional regulator with XRE-family HTH domain
MARLRRKLTSEQVADRAGVSRPTVSRIEQGEYTVSIGNYLKVLAVLNLERDLLLIGRDEALEQQLQELGLEVKDRAPQRSIKR